MGHAHLSKRGSDFMLNAFAAPDLFPRGIRCCLWDLLCRAPEGLMVNPKTSGDTKSARSATNSVRPDFPMFTGERVSTRSWKGSFQFVKKRVKSGGLCACARGELRRV